MIPIDSQVNRSKVKVKAYSSYVWEGGGIGVLQTSLVSNQAYLGRFTSVGSVAPIDATQ